MQQLDVRIKHKRDTAANWKANNPVLLAGEVIIVDDGDGNTRFKVGDGESTYTELPLRVFDNVALPTYENYTLTKDDMKAAILVGGAHTITVPSIYENAAFVIKNISTDVAIVHPDGVTIDGSLEDISLKKNEFIHIIQYSDTGYAIIADNRTTEYNLMYLNLEDTVHLATKTPNATS